MGVTLSFIFIAYSFGSITAAFVSAAGMFGAASAYGAITKRSLASIGGYAFMGLIGIVIASLVNLFLQSSSISWIISILGIGIFVVLTAWDVQKISNGQYAAATGSMEKGAVLGALSLYLDFINIFLFLLRLMGGRREEPSGLGRRPVAEPRLTVALTFDHDAISSEVDRGDGPTLRSRGEFGPRVGAPRILDLLEREAIPSTWFVPGHTLVTFPDSAAAVVAAGHEIGCHGWAHEDLADIGPDAERDVMERSVEAVGRVPARRRGASVLRTGRSRRAPSSWPPVSASAMTRA